MRGGGEYVGANVTVGKKQLVYGVSWTKPYFLDTPWTVGVEGMKVRNEFAAKDYTIKAYSVQLFANYQINAFVRGGFQYRLRHSFITLKHMKHDSHNGELIRECFKKLGSHIKSCHAKDILLQKKLTTHLDEVRPGLGGLDYSVFLAELSRLPDTPLMLEHLPNAEEYRLAAEHIRSVAAKAGLSFV